MLYDHFKHRIMMNFLMINFDAYFDNVMTMKLILTNVVLILQVKPPNVVLFFMSFLPNGVLA